jgi:hypothetical protein
MPRLTALGRVGQAGCHFPCRHRLFSKPESRHPRPEFPFPNPENQIPDLEKASSGFGVVPPRDSPVYPAGGAQSRF